MRRPFAAGNLIDEPAGHEKAGHEPPGHGQSENSRTAVLGGVRVLDLTQFLAGPHATMLLAGMGAEVIRIDNPRTGDVLSGSPFFYGQHGPSFEKRDDTDRGVAFLKRLRGKKSITLDLKAAEGRALFLRLVEQADVVIENFAPGATERLGIDWAAVQRVNPRIVYCSLTGFGHTGPDKDRKAFDLIAQAMSGIMSLTGEPDGRPMKAGSPMADTVSAGFAFAGVLGALYHRERTGEGQFVDVSMVDVMFSLMFEDPLDNFAELGVAQRHGNRVARLCPFNTYPTTDGWLVISCGNDEQWRRVCRVMDRDDLGTDTDWGRMSWRIVNHTEVDALVGTWTGACSTVEAVGLLVGAGVAASAVHTIDDLLAWPHLHERAMIDVVEHPMLGPLPGLRAAGFPIKFSAADTGYHGAAALTGTHTRQLLTEMLGLDDDELDRLEQNNVISTSTELRHTPPNES
jgi:crotonobetainyl-CoA:carnitine CoA-transferase CaiB-like acyl-CoA transferase